MTDLKEKKRMTDPRLRDRVTLFYPEPSQPLSSSANVTVTPKKKGKN
jgi:hypothetical protein